MKKAQGEGRRHPGSSHLYSAPEDRERALFDTVKHSHQDVWAGRFDVWWAWWCV